MSRSRLSVVSEVAQVVSALAVVVSLVYVGDEIRQNTDATRAATRQAVAETDLAFVAGPLDPALLTHAEAKQRTSQPLSGVEELVLYERQHLDFRVFENAHYQFQVGLLEPEVWKRHVAIISSLLPALAVRDESENGRQTRQRGGRSMAHQDVFDVCVIGTGAGGGVMIDELTAAGFKVVALERGPQLDTSHFLGDDELSVVIRDELFSADQVETARADETSEAVTGRFNQIAFCVGGSITHWAGWSWRFRPDEFKVLSTEGPVPGASLADWPVSYEEMEPWFERAEWALGVSGAGGSNPFEGDRKKDYPNPPHPRRKTSGYLERAAKELGYTSFPVPVGINSQPYGGRAACVYGGACQRYGCPIHAKGTTLSIHLPRALASGNLDLRPDARVFEIVLGRNGRATGALYLDKQGVEQQVHARHVVVAAGSIGTPHLMLMSRSPSFPDGIANSSGLVGRNLTFHHFAGVHAVMDEPTRHFTGVEAHTGIDDLHPSDPERGFIRGGVITEGNPVVKQPLVYCCGRCPATRD